MNHLISKRLRLIPLNAAELRLLCQGLPVLETALALNPSNFYLNYDDSFLDEFEHVIPTFVLPRVEGHPENYEWYTHWILVEVTAQMCIGGIGAWGPPDLEGRVGIGYFVHGDYEGRGYATEAVACFVQWLLTNPDVKAVTADTLSEGYGSQQVLQRNGFQLSGPTEEGLRWQRLR